MAMSHSSDKSAKDLDNFSLKFYKSSSSLNTFQRLPKCWNVKDRSKCLRLSHFALTVTYTSGFSERQESNYNTQDIGSVRSDVHIPLTTGIYYFEVTLLNKGNNGSFSIGLSTKSCSLSKFPGSEYNSFGYQTDGCMYHGSPNAPTKFGPRISDNDIIGCGIDFISQSLFFTRNGVFLGKAFEGIIPVGSDTRIYPTVGLCGRGVRINANFGQSPFQYAFDNYIKNERINRENNLVEKMCKEEFAGSKMKELVSGYLVHHGYVATAKSFSNWSNLSQLVGDIDTKKPEAVAKRNDKAKLSSVTSGKNYFSDDQSGGMQTSIQRRHSDSSCISLFNADGKASNQLPGIASMLHRRRLRALCRHCQYGKAAVTLNRLYPQVFEKCPELLVQLRCRQLIEMMHRHSVRRGYSTTCNSNNESTDSSSTTMPPKIQKTSNNCVRVEESKCLNNGQTLVKMDVDSEDQLGTITTSKKRPNKDIVQNDEGDGVGLSDYEDSLDGDNDDDDDGFGMDDDDTGLYDAKSSAKLHPIADPAIVSMEIDNHHHHHHNHDEDVNTLWNSASSNNGVGAIDGDNGNANGVNSDDMQQLMRHVQFGRSLVNLVKQVRAKTGGLSLETERLLQQSVSLLAYPSPTSTDCPLRSLLDPVWRDTIASVINSAVLKAHDLPAQPALEQGLRALQRCFQDRNFVEAQTLGHFLFYHLTPTQLAKAASETHQSCLTTTSSNKRLRSSQDTSSNTLDDSNLNGHYFERRRSWRQRARRQELIVPDRPSNKDDDDDDDDDDEEEEEEEEGEDGRCDSDDDDDFDNGDDDDDESEASGLVVRRPHTRSRNAAGRGLSRSSNETSSENRGSNGGSGGGGGGSSNSSRIRSSTFATVPPNIQVTRPTVLTRYCPAFLINPTSSRLVTALPSVVNRTSTAPARRLVNSSSAAPQRVQLRTSSRNHSTSYLDSAFHGLFPIPYPHPTEFLAAVDDTLKAYTGFLFSLDDESVMSPNVPNSRQRFHHDRPPSPSNGAGGGGGGGACPS